MGLRGVLSLFSPSEFFRFDTHRYVSIENRPLGWIYRLIQSVIVLYVIGFVFIYQHGYQTKGRVHSTVVTKVKGVTFTNFSDEELGVSNPEEYRRIWDTPDYVFPAQSGDHGGFFLMTNVVITPNQRKGRCPEDPTKVRKSKCKDDADCRAKTSFDTGNGVQTGKCVPSIRDPNITTCEINAWCPVAQDILPFNGMKALLREAYNFTLLIKNVVSFPKFGPHYLKRNILEGANKTFLKDCLYNRKDKEIRFCPVFRIRDIVGSEEEFNEIAVKGGVYVIHIDWNCNLDLDFSKCHPHYEFSRMDNKKARIAPGLNFRYAKYHGNGERTLYKVYGIKFLIEVSGYGRKTDIVPILLNIGAAVGLLGLAQFLTGFVVALCLRNENLVEIKKKKFLHVVDNSNGIFESSPGTFNKSQN